jgi:hypothetical protein
MTYLRDKLARLYISWKRFPDVLQVKDFLDPLIPELQEILNLMTTKPGII